MSYVDTDFDNYYTNTNDIDINPDLDYDGLDATVDDLRVFLDSVELTDYDSLSDEDFLNY